MIEESYVSFEVAKLLKEKGFKEWCRHCYGVDVRHNGKSISFDEECELKDEGFGNEIEYVEGGKFHNCWYDNDTEDVLYAAPSLYLAMKWLREVYKIFISIQQHMDMSYVWYSYMDGAAKGCDRESHNNSYEEACEAAIKYCLENLI